MCLSPAPTGSHGPCNNTRGKSLPLFGPFFKQEATCSSGVWVAGPPRVDRLAVQDMGLAWPLHILPASVTSALLTIFWPAVSSWALTGGETSEVRQGELAQN